MQAQDFQLWWVTVAQRQTQIDQQKPESKPGSWVAYLLGKSLKNTQGQQLFGQKSSISTRGLPEFTIPPLHLANRQTPLSFTREAAVPQSQRIHRLKEKKKYPSVIRKTPTRRSVIKPRAPAIPQTRS